MSYYNPNLIEVYDIECYPNIFTYTGIFPETGDVRVFEVSERRNDITALREYLKWLKHHKFTQVGFNNVGYDYPVIHEIMTKLSVVDHLGIYQKSHAIINSGWNNRFRNIIPEWQREIPQLDLFLINHFDNQAKSTSLKMLEFVMRVDDIQDLPFVPEVDVPVDQFDNLIKYNIHDVNCTIKFYRECQGIIQFRGELSERFKKSLMNHNDGKVGKEFFLKGLEKDGVKVTKDSKTYRDYVDLGEGLFPYIKFDHPEFNRILNIIKQTRIDTTVSKPDFKVSAVIDGFSYDIGLGGIHASVKGKLLKSDDEYIIEDFDFASWYPHLSFNHGVYPEHLSPVFCETYKSLYLERKAFKKAGENTLQLALKYALNIAYGDSNSVFSPFYDTKYTYTITMNGQMILCMLADQLIKIPNLQMIQCNTDGLTVRYPRIHKEKVHEIGDWIQQVTGIELEDVEYSMMAIRDVNNYLAVKMDGSTKHVGAYCYDTEDRVGGLAWHQNHSALICVKAACAAIIDGVNVREFIINHDDMYDFFLCTKVKRADSLILKAPVMWGEQLVYPSVKTEKLQNITRYYVSNTGKSLVKLSSPLKRRTPKVQMFMPHHNRDIKKQKGLNKNLEVNSQHEYDSAIKKGYKTKDGGSYEIGSVRETGVDKDWLVTPVNTITPDINYDINYEYYITEAEKLVNKIL